VNTGKVVANAGSHRIMYALSFGPAPSKELKVIAGAINSVSRFDGEYMARLVSNGFVRRHEGDRWALTKRGHEKLQELGPCRGLRPRRAPPPQLQAVIDRPTYNPSDEKPLPMRPGSEDFLKYPSRMGNTLYYRDGRIELIGEDDGH
jgi:predicted transcriptional regulator